MRHWKLTSGTYWRDEGDEILLASPEAVLRLNATSARLFAELLGIQEPDSAASQGDQGMEALTRLLLGHRMIIRTPEVWDPATQHLAHVDSTGDSLEKAG